MNVRYLFSSPNGDIPADEGLLTRPFLLGPLQEHPLLKLGDYFKAVERFILGEDGKALFSVLEKTTGRSLQSPQVTELLIRSEKHGGLYHLSSVEIKGENLRQKFVVSTAVTGSSRHWLRKEFETLELLNDSFRLPYLPQVLLLKELELHTSGSPDAMVMMLGQWFEDYHEWHLHKGEEGEPHLVIWDFSHGYRRAEELEIFQIYRQASLILTLYYNLKTTHQIHPWLHAAGDFIVKSTNGSVDLRLTTARGYEPLMIFQEDQELNGLTGLLYFFINLTIRMRIDRWEGVGEIAWAGEPSVRPTAEGFLQGLRSKEAGGAYEIGRVSDFVGLLKSFQPDELRRMAVSLLELNRREDPEAATVIERNLDDHCSTLFSAIRDLPG